jgi:hypothetical protein
MVDWQGGLSGAASGAAAGSATGTPWGIAGGAVIGGIAGALGGGGEDEEQKRRQELAAKNQNLLSMLRGKYSDARDQTATESPFFEAGAGALREQQERQRRADAASAVRRGAAGSEYEMAQAARRQRELGSGLRELAGSAQQHLQQQRRGARRGMLRQRENLNALALRDLERRARNERAAGRRVQDAVMGAASILGKGGAFAGGSSGG